MKKILLIEDDDLISKMYSQSFKAEGYEVVTAMEGQSGLDLAASEKPDLIFCDIMMPKMNGLEVLESLKANSDTKDIPVVMLTNMSGTNDSQIATQKGALGYLIKSDYKPKEIVEKAKEFIQNGDANAEENEDTAKKPQEESSKKTDSKSDVTPNKEEKSDSSSGDDEKPKVTVESI